MTSPFINQTYTVEKTLLYAFRAQAARCHEYIIFMDRMKQKYPDSRLVKDGITFVNRDLILNNCSNWCGVDKQLENTDGFTEDDKQTFVLKFTRMLEAKRTFQNLNGDYRVFR